MFINFNGAIIRSGKGILTADNRSFRYGDGLFETIRVAGGRILLDRYHFDRLMAGASLLQFQIPPSFSPENLSRQILELCARNGQLGSARVRLVVFRGDGPLNEPTGCLPNYIIQSWAFPEQAFSVPLQSGNWAIDIFPDGRKACDPLSNLKSNNYLVYVLATLCASRLGVDDCLVLTAMEGSPTVLSPTFSIASRERCIHHRSPKEESRAYMRRFLIETLPRAGFPVYEKGTALQDLEDADEVFLTNALRGIRPVTHFRGVSYRHQLTMAIGEALNG